MLPNRHLPLPASSVVAVLLLLVWIMFLMEWGNVAYRDSVHGEAFVRYTSRIAGLPVLMLLVWLVVRDHRQHFRQAFSRDGLTARIIVCSIAIGFLARVFWWAQITARIAFGWLDSALAAPPRQLQIGFSCPELPVLAMAVIVGCVLVPITEEFVHRGVLMSAWSNRGRVVAVSASALLFAAMHRAETFWFVLLSGVVLGALYWNARTLWAPIIAHATYDGLIVFDWYCLKTSWNPSPAELPLIAVGVTACIAAASSATGVAYLAGSRRVGPRPRPDP